jgi:hypothetical protein
LFLFVCIRLEAISKRIFWLKRTHFAGILEAKYLKKKTLLLVFGASLFVFQNTYIPLSFQSFACLKSQPKGFSLLSGLYLTFYFL